MLLTTSSPHTPARDIDNALELHVFSYKVLTHQSGLHAGYLLSNRMIKCAKFNNYTM